MTATVIQFCLATILNNAGKAGWNLGLRYLELGDAGPRGAEGGVLAMALTRMRRLRACEVYANIKHQMLHDYLPSSLLILSSRLSPSQLEPNRKPVHTSMVNIYRIALSSSSKPVFARAVGSMTVCQEYTILNDAFRIVRRG